MKDMKKPTKPQLAAMKKIAAYPMGTFHQQFGCQGVDSGMRTRMGLAGWIFYDAVTQGYRLTDAGRAQRRSCT